MLTTLAIFAACCLLAVVVGIHGAAMEFGDSDGCGPRGDCFDCEPIDCKICLDEFNTGLPLSGHACAWDIRSGSFGIQGGTNLLSSGVGQIISTTEHPDAIADNSTWILAYFDTSSPNGSYIDQIVGWLDDDNYLFARWTVTDDVGNGNLTMWHHNAGVDDQLHTSVEQAPFTKGDWYNLGVCLTSTGNFCTYKSHTANASAITTYCASTNATLSPPGLKHGLGFGVAGATILVGTYDSRTPFNNAERNHCVRCQGKCSGLHCQPGTVPFELQAVVQPASSMYSGTYICKATRVDCLYLAHNGVQCGGDPGLTYNQCIAAGGWCFGSSDPAGPIFNNDGGPDDLCNQQCRSGPYNSFSGWGPMSTVAIRLNRSGHFLGLGYFPITTPDSTRAYLFSPSTPSIPQDCWLIGAGSTGGTFWPLCEITPINGLTATVDAA